MSISFDEAYAATDPSLSDDARKASAQRIIEGIAANEIYWGHRSQLEALQARYEGHGIVARGPDEEGQDPTQVGPATASDPNTIEGTATTVPPTTALAPGSETPDPTAAAVPVPSPDNSNEAIAKLRAQVESLGGSPEA